MYDDLRAPYKKENTPEVQLGGIIVDNKLIPKGPVHLVLKSLNRHGLIAGATGSGKTKTIQILCEQLSLAGVPSLVMDIKGDVSGLAMPGELSGPLKVRAKSLGIPFTPRGYPVEFLTLSESHLGVPLRATVEGFGPILFARMLELNDTQEGVISILFQFAKQEKIPLVDLADLKSLFLFAQSDEGKAKIEANYGAVATTTLGIILRKMVSLESQGGDEFFGEPAFDVLNLLNINQGLGVISILRLLDMQEKPQLFSTFMLKLLSDMYRLMPELGDPDKPKLVMFIDEAHLIFRQASKALLNLLDTIVKLIRSKGVGIIFCTQNPNDIPENILSQLGLKIQHALRAFTAKDRKEMKLVAQNFPPSSYYNTEQLLTSLGIGEALVSALNAKGQPTPLIQCLIRPPESRMGVISQEELQHIVSKSTLYPHYQQKQISTSAKDILTPKEQGKRNSASKSPEREKSSVTEIVSGITKNTLFRQIIRQLVRDGTKALLSIFKKKS